MIGVTSIVGVVVLIAAIVALLKFAEGTITAVISVAVILVALFLIFGAPNVGFLSDTFGEIKGFIPTTGSTIFSGEAVEITSMENQGNNLAINVKNEGTKNLIDFEVFINDKPANILVASTLLPGTKGTIIVDRGAQRGDAIFIRSGSAKDKEMFGSALAGDATLLYTPAA
tara:strand:+ start:595 stop:1107 length:513 start_codon:yes stop_codon:yes gene_type:complete